MDLGVFILPVFLRVHQRSLDIAWGNLFVDYGGDPPSLPPKLSAFKRLVASCGKRKGSSLVQQFVKKVDIPTIELPAERPCRTAQNLSERGLIGQFTELWPSSKAIDRWVQRNWRPLVTEGIRNHLVERVYYVFAFDSEEDKDLIF